jgi:DNA modification methylase
LFPHPAPDSEYGWYEFPQAVVDRIVEVTIPKGGKILDPFFGKGAALRALPDKYMVTGIDLS